jgi:hypothetical protein
MWRKTGRKGAEDEAVLGAPYSWQNWKGDMPPERIAIRMW